MLTNAIAVNIVVVADRVTIQRVAFPQARYHYESGGDPFPPKFRSILRYSRPFLRGVKLFYPIFFNNLASTS
jgi:hypothetical protein